MRRGSVPCLLAMAHIVQHPHLLRVYFAYMLPKEKSQMLGGEGTHALKEDNHSIEILAIKIGADRGF